MVCSPLGLTCSSVNPPQPVVPPGHFHLCSVGSSTGCSVDTCFSVALPWSVNKYLPQPGLLYGCFGAWTTSSLFFSLLGIHIVFSHAFCLTPDTEVQYFLLFLKQASLDVPEGWFMGSAVACSRSVSVW